MKKNTLRQRLAVYKKALKDYENEVQTDLGFCHYFRVVCEIWVFVDFFEINLPELSRFQPNKYPESYWCPSGETKPRIAILKKAIRYTESQIKKGKK